MILRNNVNEIQRQLVKVMRIPSSSRGYRLSFSGNAHELKPCNSLERSLKNAITCPQNIANIIYSQHVMP